MWQKSLLKIEQIFAVWSQKYWNLHRVISSFIIDSLKNQLNSLLTYVFVFLRIISKTVYSDQLDS